MEQISRVAATCALQVFTVKTWPVFRDGMCRRREALTTGDLFSITQQTIFYLLQGTTKPLSCSKHGSCNSSSSISTVYLVVLCRQLAEHLQDMLAGNCSKGTRCTLMCLKIS